MDWKQNIEFYKLILNTTFTEYPEYKAAIWIWRLFSPVLIMIGTIGNILSLAVLLRKRLRSSSTMFFLTVLAVVDIAVLFSGLLRLWFENAYDINIREYSELSCRFHTFFVYFTSSYSVWIIVAVTLDRCIIICTPFKAKSLSSLSKARKTALIIAVILICFNAQIFYTQTLVAVDYFEGGIRCSHAMHSKYFRDYVWPWMDFCVYCFIPFSVMIVCNLLIIRRITLSARKLKQHVSNDLSHPPQRVRIAQVHTVKRLSVLALAVSNAVASTSQTPTREERDRDTAFSFHPQVSVDVSRKAQNRSTSLTVMLLVVNFVFMILVLPITIYLIGFQVWIENADSRKEARLELGWAIVNVLQYTNNSIHFFLYCLTGPRFRREFLSIFKKNFGQKRVEPSDTQNKEASHCN